jgi:hypothetical protein
VPETSGKSGGERVSAAGLTPAGAPLGLAVGHIGSGVLTAQAVSQSAPPIMKIFCAHLEKTAMTLLLLEALGALLILVFIVWWTMFSGRQGGEIKTDEKVEKKDKKSD